MWGGGAAPAEQPEPGGTMLRAIELPTVNARAGEGVQAATLFPPLKASDENGNPLAPTQNWWPASAVRTLVEKLTDISLPVEVVRISVIDVAAPPTVNSVSVSTEAELQLAFATMLLQPGSVPRAFACGVSVADQMASDEVVPRSRMVTLDGPEKFA